MKIFNPSEIGIIKNVQKKKKKSATAVINKPRL